MTLLTTMLDFTDTGELGLLVDEQSVAAREAAIGNGGLLQGKELAQVLVAARQRPDLALRRQQLPEGQGAAGLRPAVLERATTPTCRGRCSAGTCAIPTSRTTCASRARPSSAACRWTWADRHVPAFLYASREDHIVPWQTAYAVQRRLLGGDNTFVLGASGHIAGVINPPAKKKRNYWIGGRGGP